MVQNVRLVYLRSTFTTSHLSSGVLYGLLILLALGPFPTHTCLDDCMKVFVFTKIKLFSHLVVFRLGLTPVQMVCLAFFLFLFCLIILVFSRWYTNHTPSAYMHWNANINFYIMCYMFRALDTVNQNPRLTGELTSVRRERCCAHLHWQQVSCCAEWLTNAAVCLIAVHICLAAVWRVLSWTILTVVNVILRLFLLNIYGENRSDGETLQLW